MNFSALKKFSSSNIYILDASAILNDSQFGDYHLRFKGQVESLGVFLVTTPFLQELDNVNHRRNRNSEHNRFMEKLREILSAGKLSEGQTLSSGNKVVFLKENLSNLEDTEYNFLGKESIDGQLLNLALKLKADLFEKVSILSADSLLKVMCHEAEVTYIYIPPPELRALSHGETNRTSNENFKVTSPITPKEEVS